MPVKGTTRSEDMAIDKKASVKKAASAFKQFNVPVGSNGQPLTRNEHQEYVDPVTKQRYNPEVHGMARHVTRPVLTEQDLLDKENFPLQARTLGIKKYQDIIKELRNAIVNTKCGVVNFVIGAETENAEAILKAALPPGSGAVYKGFDGYDISATNWGNLGQARGALAQTILGTPKAGLDRQSLEYYRRITTEIEARPQDGNRPRPATPLSVLNQIPANIAFAEADEDSVPIGPGAATAPRPAEGTNNTQQYERILSHIDELQAGMDEAKRQMRIIENRHDQEKDKTDPDGLSQSRRYDELQVYYNRCKSYLATRQSELPRLPDQFGGMTYDGTGFLDVTDAKKLYGKLFALLDPQKTIEYHISESGVSGTPPNEQMIARVYDSHKTEMIETIQSLQRSSPPDVQTACANILTIIEKPFDQIRAAKGAMEKAISILCMKVASQNRVLIINNVDESALVDQSQHDDSKPLRFMADDLIADYFAPNQKRNKKVIVLVSRRPIQLGIQGVIQVPNNSGSFLVDEDEGVALVSYCIDKCRAAVGKRVEEVRRQKAFNQANPTKIKAISPDLEMLSTAAVDVGSGDINRLAQMITGKTQVAAYQFLTQIFSGVVNRQTGGVVGLDLSREARRKNNENIREGTTYTDTAGKTFHLYRAMTRKEADLSIDEYIHSKRTDWGTKVEKIGTLIKGVRSKAKVQKILMDQEHKIKSGQIQASTDQVWEIRQKIRQLEQGMQTSLHNGIKHFIILYGDPGCGKSAYPEAFANQLGYDLVDCDFGQTRGGLVGQSESFFSALLESWKRMSDVVIRLDEIDGQVASESEEAVASYAAGPMKQLLTFFQDHEGLLKKRNIFVVATTNHLERIRPALTNRAEVSKVEMPFDQETFIDFLKAAIRIIRRNQPIGLFYDPEAGGETSVDLWEETERFWKSLEPEFPRMAQALVPTRMPLRSLIDFIYQMFTSHRNYVESVRMIRLYNEDRAKYMEEYSEFCKKDKKTGQVICPPPQKTGFPFTSDNFCRAAALSYPADGNGNRLDPIRDRDRTRQFVFGTEELDRQVNGISRASPAAASPQPEFNFFGGSPQEDDLMPAASPTTVASNDYYYDQLIKSGFARKVAQEVARNAPRATMQPETESQTFERFRNRNFRPGDVYEEGIFGLYPIPPPSKLEM